jgi:beta-lactamase class A
MRIAAYMAALVICLSSVAAAQTAAPSASPSAPASLAPSAELARTRADALLRGGHADATWFSAVFLAQGTPAMTDAIIARLKTTLGAYTSIDGVQGHYTAHFEKGTDEVLVHLDAAGKIDGLFFRPPKLQAKSLDDALRQLRPPSGTLSYVITEGSSELAALNASEPLAVGSAFKLAVLEALRDEVNAGRRHWEDVVPLDARWKSLPSGAIAEWPDGMPLTIATYAAEMISISDNTAADALVRLTGPQALAPYAKSNAPFLTTREAFTLQSTAAAGVRKAYLAATTPAQRGDVLRAVDALPLPAAEALDTTPELAIEWGTTACAICAA